MMVSQNGHLEVVERLIAAGAKVDAARKVNPPDCLAAACFATELQDTGEWCLHRLFTLLYMHPKPLSN
jgi:hypothetical protein